MGVFKKSLTEQIGPYHESYCNRNDTVDTDSSAYYVLCMLRSWKREVK